MAMFSTKTRKQIPRGRALLFPLTVIGLASISALLVASSSLTPLLVSVDIRNSTDDASPLAPFISRDVVATSSKLPPQLPVQLSRSSTITMDDDGSVKNASPQKEENFVILEKEKEETTKSKEQQPVSLACAPSNDPSLNRCWLSPSWGSKRPIVDMPTTNTSAPCVGGKPASPTTSARRLTCLHKGQYVRRCFEKHDGFTIGILYYSSPALLRLQLQTITSYPEEIRKQLTVLIVDDGSPPNLGALDYITGEDRRSVRIRVATVKEDILFNDGGARNLIGHLTDTEQMLLLDLDVTVPAKVIANMITWKTRSTSGHAIAHKFNRIRPDRKTKKMHPAIVWLDVDAYWAAGGCDEDLSGSYGFADVLFWYRFNKNPNNKSVFHKQDFLPTHKHDRCNQGLLGNDSKLVAKCTDASKNLSSVSKDRTRNNKILGKKKKTGCWSNQYLRFTYTLSE